ncbi:hypothetical protein ABIC78_002306 [Novosphingobium sp. 1529]
MQRVVGRIVPIDEAERVAFGIAVDRLGDRGAQHQRVINVLVGRLQPPDPVGRGLQPAQSLVRVFQIERVFTALVGEAVDPHEAFDRDVIQHHVAQPIPAQFQHLGLRQRHKAHRNQHL